MASVMGCTFYPAGQAELQHPSVGPESRAPGHGFRQFGILLWQEGLRPCLWHVTCFIFFSKTTTRAAFAGPSPTFPRTSPDTFPGAGGNSRRLLVFPAR